MSAQVRSSSIWLNMAAAWCVSALVACPDVSPCTRSGHGFLLIAQIRAPAVADIETEGACEVESPTASCDAGGCIKDGDGGLDYLYHVKGSARGGCTVTVTFSDGGPPQVEKYAFIGPNNECCRDVCVQGGGIHLPLEHSPD